MKTPVLIAAHNEAEYIDRTLGRLDSEVLEPFVVANGSTDATADIARYHLPADHVIELSEQGKLPALQHGLKYLGARALEPVLLTDADSFPLYPRAWQQRMVDAVSGDTPAVASGLTGFWDSTVTSCGVRTLRRVQRTISSRLQNTSELVYGYNMAINLADAAMLDEVMALEHTWPGEDRYLTDVIRDKGEFKQLVDVRTLVLGSARYLPTLRQRMRRGGAHVRGQMAEDYVARRAEGVTHRYDGRLIPYKEL